MKTWLRMAFVLIVIPLISGQIFSDENHLDTQRKLPADSFTFSVDVGLVLLPVTVVDKSGSFVSGLEKGAFTIYEDGAEQQIQVFEQKDLPVAVGLVIDSSGSMLTKRADVTSAALELAESSNPGDHVFVIHFHQHVVFALRLGEAFTSDIEELREAVSRNAGHGKTALYDAVVAGLEHLQHSQLKRRVLVVVSDGGDNASYRTLKDATDMAAASNTLIYTIGIYNDHDENRNPKVLRRLAEITGGEAYFPRNRQQLSEAGRRIAKDIRSQYVLGYIPTNREKDGKYREIKVKVDAPHRSNLTIRTRSGYLPQ